MTVHDTLARTGPRKLLALDGGGIRGLISIEVLAEIERTLQARLGRDDTFVLSDYFDYVAGTSTGAIIATCVALGMRVDQIRTFYVDNGTEMFEKSSIVRRFRFKYQDERLAVRLKTVLGADTTLGSDKLRILLMIVMRNASTDSPWPLSNNPAAAFNQPELLANNLQLPLWQLVRASTAAPTFFPPEVVEVGAAEPFVFVDGGVTVYNNPAFQLFLMATIEPYRLGWTANRDQMLLVSIGTGASPKANTDLVPGDMNLVYHAQSIPGALMFSALNEQDLLCRVFGDCRHGAAIDVEVGDLVGAAGPVEPKLFTYMRYNAELSDAWLLEHDLGHVDARHVQRMDSTDCVAELQAVGCALARRVAPAHFDGFV